MRFGTLYPTILVLLALVFQIATGAHAGEVTGYLEAEEMLVWGGGQERGYMSLAMQPEYYHPWESGHSFTFTPFWRLADANTGRSHFDIRELNFLWPAENWELRVGVGKVFWGTAEFVHLVDIINQSDLAENGYGEVKLGQPMIQFTWLRNWGVLEAFMMPYFRLRNFPRPAASLLYPLPVVNDRASFESGAGQSHVDFAIRYSHNVGNWDIGVSHFHGTGREPLLSLATGAAGEAILVPHYPLIDQTGLDLQLVAGSWLLKFEAIRQAGTGWSNEGAVAGFEYTFVGLWGARSDLGVVVEVAGDSRGARATEPFRNAVILGLRFAFNDAQNTQFLIGLIEETTSATRGVQLEASRRLGDRWKATLESNVISVPSGRSVQVLQKNDGLLRFGVAYYY